MYDNRNFDMHGIHLISKYGDSIGVLDFYGFIPGINKYVLYYITQNERGEKVYVDRKVKCDEFDMYKGYAKEKSDRYIIMNKRSIHHVYHFSPVENTQNILEYGILSREEAVMKGVQFKFTDPNRYDGELNSISASISFPNYKMRYSLEMKGEELVIYDIDPKILLRNKLLDIQFYYTNAANSIFRYIDKNTLTTNEAFEKMFTEDNRQPNLNRAYTTDPQAEALIDTEIPLEYVQTVVTNYENIKVKNLCKDRGIYYCVDRSIYAPRCDYERW